MKTSGWEQGNPGSDTAIVGGCTCPVLDNFRGRGRPTNTGLNWWITGGCPLHDPAGYRDVTAKPPAQPRSKETTHG